MTKEQCQDLHIVGKEYPEKYDGVWEWCCTKTKQTRCRWNLRDNARISEDENALDKLCDCCEIPSQD